MNKVLVFAWVAFLTLGFSQSTTQEVLACTTIDIAEERLACYDALASKLNPPKVSSVNKWNIKTETNPVDDTKTVVFTNVADEGRARFGNPIVLFLRCQSGIIESFISWDDYLGSDTTKVTYRIGTADATTDTWYISTDKTATFFSLNESLDRQFVNDLAAADNGRFVAQVTPYSESTVTAVFDVSGLIELLPQLFEPCP